jgi:GNAT superfamily N-acetyltransferase
MNSASKGRFSKITCTTFSRFFSQNDKFAKKMTLQTTKDIVIRPAIEADIPEIHALMFELAVYENSPESVEATVNEYLEDFKAGLFESHVAVLDGKIVGMILYFMTYSSWRGKMLYLDDFVVTESCRRYGVGQMLFDTFQEEARSRGCRLSKWQVLDWNEPAIRFYEKNNCVIEKDWWNVKMFLKTVIVLCLFAFGSCEGQEKPLDADTRQIIDSISTDQIRIARQELDSLCQLSKTTTLPRLIDSIKAVRKREIEEKLKVK